MASRLIGAVWRGDCPLRRPAPRLGEHSREILYDAGLGEAEISDLLARGIAIEPG